MTKERYSPETLKSFKRTFNQAVLQITDRPGAGAGSSGTASKMTITALITYVGSAVLEKYLGVSLLP